VTDTQLLLERIQTLEQSLAAKSKQLNESKERLTMVEVTCDAAQTALRAEQQLLLSEKRQLAHSAQKLEISRERKAELKTSLAHCQKELRIEQQQKLILERAFEDMERERKAPFFVPELFEAMMKIADISTLVESSTVRRSF
jgi:hypothetical protein